MAACEQGSDVTILCKSRTGGSGNSVVAMSVHRFAPDAPDLREDYRQRFTASGASEQNEDTAAFFVDRAAGYMERLRTYGFPLEYRCLEENGEEHPYLACCRPKQGRILTGAVRQYLEEHTKVTIEDNTSAVDIITENGQACGVIALRGGQLFYYPAGTVILACGGAGNVYASTSNTSDVTGDGYGMAHRVGLPLYGMEFVQFYPYRIYSPKVADIFPDIFDHGAVFRNEKGERFMDQPCYPKKEQENRDVVARAMYWQKEVRLDLTDCDMAYLERECPNIAAMYRTDKERPLLLRPVAHFFMGGVPLRKDCSTDVKGLFVCGEVTGGLHGANRLAGSALTETVMFGRIAGEQAAAAPKASNTVPAEAINGVMSTYPTPGADDLRELRDALRDTMWQNVSVIRCGADMEKALREIGELKARFTACREADLKAWMELRNLLYTGETVTGAALARTESKGAHFRTDRA